MKKSLQQLLFVWTLGLFAFNVNAQVSIGSGTLVDQGMPIDPYFGYSYSQSVYLASEIGASGTITGVTFYATPSTDLLNASDWVVYMAATPRTTYASNTDWEPIASFTEVFNGTATIVGGEVVITFTTPFVYNGTDNLIIAAEDNMAGFDGSSDDFYCSAVTGNRSIYYRNDSNNPDPLTPPTASGLRQSVPNIEFAGITQSCPVPSALTATTITATSADLGWTENGTATTWNIEWGTAGFTPTGTANIAATMMNPQPLSGLTDNTDYEFYVQSDCGGSGTSSWAGPFSFSTPCGTFTPNYLTDFSTYVPSCWDIAGNGTIQSGPSDIGSSLWGQSGSLARINLYTTNRTDWLLSPTFDLSAGGWELAVEASANDFNSLTAFNGMGSDDSVQVVISTDGGASWIELYSFNTTTPPILTPTVYSIDLSAYTGTANMFGIRAGDGPVNDAPDYYFNVHSFEIRVPPTCVDPSAIAVANITATSADVSWTAGNGSQNGWEVSVVDAGMPAMGGTASATTTFNATGLTDDSSFDVYVREICGVGDTSGWIGPVSFSTPCGVFTPDYLEDFTNYVPGCWEEATGLLTTSTALTVGTSQWTSDGFANSSAAGAARINIWDTNQDEWLLSPSIDLTGGPFQLEYDVALTTFSGTAATTMDADDSLAIVISTDNGATWSNANILQSYTDGTEPSNTGQHEYIDLSSYSGVVRFGLYGKSTNNLAVDNNAYIDNFEVKALCLPATSTDTQVACETYTWIDGNTYTSSINSATFTIAGGSSEGCDSIITLDLTINNPTTSTDVQVACDSLIWIDGMTYTTSNNTATFLIAGGNVNGCDSTITLDLTINNSVAFTDVQTSCDSLVWNGATYTASGMYMWTGMNVNGCDSVVTLDLTINNSSSSVDTQVACDSLVWNGTTYTTSGVYSWIGTNAVGCDSSVILNLTINNSSTTTDTQTACDSLVWNGTTYTTSGTYTWTGTGATGCDSTVTLDLTINNSSLTTEVETACISYDWNGMTYTTTGVYSWTGTNAAGCDSIVVLDLTINAVDVSVTNNDPSITANAMGATYVWIDCDNNNDPIMGETAQTFTATANGNYAVIVTENGCSDTSACTAIVTVSLDDLSPLEVVSVYPNPVSNVVNVDLGGLENVQVRLLDMSGKVLRTELCETTDLFTMEMNQAPGAYIIEVQSNEFVKQFKLIKE
jgi:hypothetical protein